MTRPRKSVYRELTQGWIALETGNSEAALEAAQGAEGLATIDGDRAEALLLAAESWLIQEDLGQAQRCVEKALEIEPDFSDAHHFLGSLHELRGNRDAMVRSFLRVRELDTSEPVVSWSLPHAELVGVAEQTLEDLPERARELLANVPILIEDYPPIDLIRDGFDPRMLGFFRGTPYPEQSSVGGLPQLDCIFLFQRNIERVARSREDAVEEIRTTILHETGHFFALDDDDLEEIGLG